MNLDRHGLPTEPGDPRDMALARQAVEIEELRMALGQALEKLRQVGGHLQKAREIAGHYL